MEVTITGGSEKQNAWASSIATQWLDKINNYIADQLSRNDPLIADYVSALQSARKTMVEGFAKVSAKQIIDMKTRQIDLAEAMIRKAKA